MRKRVTDFQNQVESDLDSVEENIHFFLRQAEQIYADRALPVSEIRLQVAQSCMRGLRDFRTLRHSLLAKRHLFDSISTN
jgi:hypothetical protein